MPDDLQTVMARLRQASAFEGDDTPAPATLKSVMDSLQTTVTAQAPETRQHLFEQRQKRLSQPISAAPGQTVTAAGMGLVGGLVKGLFSPVSAFMPDAFNDQLDAWEEDSTRKMLGMIARSQYKTTYQAAPMTTSFLAGAPTSTGEIVGAAIPLVATMGVTHSAFAVDAANSISASIARKIAAGATAGGMLAAAAKLDPGESRFAKVAQDSVMMGAFEMVGIPSMVKAWKEETPGIAEAVVKHLNPALRAAVPYGPAEQTLADVLARRVPERQPAALAAGAAEARVAERRQAYMLLGQRAAEEKKATERAITGRLTGRTGRIPEDVGDEDLQNFLKKFIAENTPKSVEPELTAIRAGVPASESVVDAVVNVAKGNPELETSPIVLQAVKQKEARRRLTQPKVTVDHLLSGEDPNFAARIMISVEGERPEQIDIRHDPTNPQHFSTQVDAAKAEITQLAKSGARVEVTAVVGSTQEDATSVLNALQGKKPRTPNPNRRKRKVPGAAPEASVAENGDVPQAGSVVTIAEPDKPLVKGTVVTQSTTPQTMTDEELIAITKRPPSEGGTAESAAEAYTELRRRGRPEGVQSVSKSVTVTNLKTGERNAYNLEQGTRHTTIDVEPVTPQMTTLYRGGGKGAYYSSFEGDAASYGPVHSVQVPTADLEKYESQTAEAIRMKKSTGNTEYILPPELQAEPPVLRKRGRPKKSTVVEGEDFPAVDEDAIAREADRRARAEGTVAVQLADNTVRHVPLAQVQVPLEVGVKQSMTLKPHLDGSDRRAIIHLDDGQISFEGRGSPQDSQQNYFRGDMFASTNPDVQWGRDPRLFIHKDGVTISVPELGNGADLVTQKRAARALIEKGVSADTPVAVRTASDVHSSAGASPAGRLRDLAAVELPLANIDALKDAAASRGLKVHFNGDKVVASTRGGARTFANSLEAHEAILRMPEAKNGNKVEAELERAWNMGSERAWDPDVDATRYLPVQLQEQGVTEVAQGKRPLAVVYTKDSRSLTETVRALERNMQLPENTFKVQLVPAMDSQGRSAAVLYNQDAVALQAAKYRTALNKLNVTSRDIPTILQQLSTKGKGFGVYTLAGRDGESAAMYAHYRDMGAKEAWERGRIETDSLGPYRRYGKAEKSAFFYPGAGDEEYFPQDLADSFAAPKVSFAADSGEKPRMFEEMAPYEPSTSFGEAPPKYDKENLPPRGFEDKGGPMAKIFGQRFRPMMELSKDLQTRTGVPFYEWYRAIEVGRNKVEQVVNPILASVRDLAKPLSRDERQQVQVLFEGRLSGADVSKTEKLVSPKVLEAVDNLHKVYSTFFEGEGFSPNDVKEFFNMFPNFRKSDGDFRYAIKGTSAVPKIAQLISKDLQNGIINIDSREFDFQRIANRVVRGTATERYLQPSWQRVSTELEAYSQARRIPNDTMQIFQRHMQEVLHMPDALHQSLARAIKQVTGKLGGRLSDVESQDAVSMLLQMNYFSNLGWQPGQVLRNAFQVLQTSYPIIGSDAFSGMRYGLRWFKDEKLQKEMIRRGVVQPDAIYAPLQEITKLAERGNTRVDKALDTFFNKGTRAMATTDDFNRVSAYMGQYTRAKRVGQQFIDGKIDWATFVEKSKLDMRDAKGGPFIAEVKKSMMAGDLETAASRMGEEFAKATQFVYTRGNAPYVMQSTFGRFLLQYGTWPAWYAENLRNMLLRGSAKNRAISLARWTATQGAMFGTANAMFGVDASRWVFFSPLGYSGGPFMQIAQQGAASFQSVVDPSSNDPIANISRARLGNSVFRQVTPLPIGAATNAFKALQDINGGRWQDATRQMLGLPPAKGPLLP